MVGVGLEVTVAVRVRGLGLGLGARVGVGVRSCLVQKDRQTYCVDTVAVCTGVYGIPVCQSHPAMGRKSPFLAGEQLQRTEWEHADALVGHVHTGGVGLEARSCPATQRGTSAMWVSFSRPSSRALHGSRHLCGALAVDNVII
jgi:hypothetical protein